MDHANSYSHWAQAWLVTTKTMHHTCCWGWYFCTDDWRCCSWMLPVYDQQLTVTTSFDTCHSSNSIQPYSTVGHNHMLSHSIYSSKIATHLSTSLLKANI